MNGYEIVPYDIGQHGFLEELCAITQQNDVVMLPLTPDKIAAQALQTIAIDQQTQQVVGYCSQSYDYGDYVEVGSLIVDPNYRGHGIGTLLVKAVHNKVIRNGNTPIAFCNPASKAIFKQLGYLPMPICSIPNAALVECGSCEHKPQRGGCCDTVVVFRNGGRTDT